MDCQEARRAIARGVEPGSRTPERVTLGFHIAGCAACRARIALAREHFLSDLLTRPLAHSEPAALPVMALRRRQRWRRPALAGALALVLILLLLVRPLILALVTIEQNIHALIVPTRLANAVPPRPASAHPLPTVTHAASGAPARQLAQLIAVSATPHALPSATATPRATPLTSSAPIPTLTITPVPLGNIGPSIAGSQPYNALALTPGPADGSVINVLILGLDQRPTDTAPGRTDTVMIVRLEPDRQRIALLSLPRDLIVPIPGFLPARINAANVYGELNPQTGGGTALARRTVSDLLGIPIDYVIRVNFEGFTGAVDALGGVDINVPTELYDPQYPTMDDRYMVAHFLPGPQHMDGATALIYSRVRHMDSDFQRMQRQQSVMVAALARLRQQNGIEQLQTLAAVTSALRSYIQTDLPEDRLLSLAWAFHSFRPEQVERYTLDGSMIQENVIPDDPYAELPLPGAIATVKQ